MAVLDPPMGRTWLKWPCGHDSFWKTFLTLDLEMHLEMDLRGWQGTLRVAWGMAHTPVPGEVLLSWALWAAPWESRGTHLVGVAGCYRQAVPSLPY